MEGKWLVWLAIGSSGVVLALSAGTAGAVAGPHVVRMVDVTGPVSVSASCSSLSNANLPQIAADPSDRAHLAVSYLLGNGRVPVVAHSSDGGQSWRQTPVPGITDCTGGPTGFAVDPSLTVGGQGRVAASESWISTSKQPGVNHDDIRMFVGRSVDDGNSFAYPVEPEPTGADQRGFLSFDPIQPKRLLVAFERAPYVNVPPAGPVGGPGFGYLPVSPGSVAVSRSEDAGGTFAPAVDAVDTSPQVAALAVGLLRAGPDVVVIAGEVDESQLPGFLLLNQPASQRVVAGRSTDGGRSFGPAVDVGTFVMGNSLDHCCIPHATGGPDGTLYVTWVDGASKSVAVARSTDHGQSWKVRNAVSTPHGATMSSIAVSPDGPVGLFYYAQSPDASHPNDTDLTPYLAVSPDGLTGWSARSIAQSFDVSAIVNGNTDGSPLGPYQGMVGLPGGFGIAVTLGAPYAPPSQERVWFIEAAAGEVAAVTDAASRASGLPNTADPTPGARRLPPLLASLAIFAVAVARRPLRGRVPR